MEELYRRHATARGVVLPNQQIRFEIGLSSTFHEGFLELVVGLESGLVKSAFGELTRAPHLEYCTRTTARLDRLAGITFGPGSGRAVRETIGGPGGCKRLEELTMTAVLAYKQTGIGLKPAGTPLKELRAEMLNREPGTAPVCRRMAAHEATGYADFTMPTGHTQRFYEAYRACWYARVQSVDPHRLLVHSSLSDPYHSPWVEIEVELPSRTIKSIKGVLERTPRGPICQDTAELLQGLVGTPAWPGDSKGVRQVVGGINGCARFEEVVNEAYRAIFQAHYALLLRQHADDPARTRHALYDFLKDSCLPYSEFGFDPEWNPQVAGDQAD